MSLILEALKKSERQRRLGESPSLGSPIMAVRRRRSLLPALVVLIVLGLVALWWFKREANKPAVEPELPAIAATASPPVMQDATTFNNNPLPPPPPPASASREAAQGSAAARQPRSKVVADASSGSTLALPEKVKSVDAAAANGQPLKPVQSADIDKTAQAAANLVADHAGQERKAAAAAMAEATAAAKGNADKPIASTNDAPPPVAAPGPGIKLMWELPYATRRELPEIHLTMHVYADEPAQRFVIINGDRQVEGDEVGSLNLIEIRRDGIVFDFEGVHFLYPRGGR